MPIRVLAPQLAARIAAGEVVERPASVVKELVENSLDAGATSVFVEISGGGLETIRVVDNGEGIPPDEVELAFQRFATSKLSPSDSLDRITTLGFRGEALGSIAAVSTVALLSRQAQQPGGVLVEVENGEIARAVPQGSPPGTSVTVRGLFRNVPARLKFMKSPSVEASRVRTLLHQLTLAYPNVAFHLDVDGRRAFSCAGSGDLRDACSAVYGPKTARSLLEATYPDPPGDSSIGVRGLISPPDINRSSRSSINIIVNRRWIQSRTLTFALEEAYQGFLMERRHPLAVVHITVPPEELDVNVHPAKLEVRFREEREVFSTLQRAVRSALVTHAPVPTVRPDTLSVRDPAARPPATQAGTTQQALSLFAPEDNRGGAHTPREIVPSLRVLGQVQNLYIVAEGPGGVYLVDQHAAHERVLYEMVRNEIEDTGLEAQGLLEPVVVELTPLQEEAFEAHRSEWTRYGFELEAFGPNSLLLRGLPSFLSDADPKEAFLSVLEDMGQGKEAVDWEERITSSIACHSAVRAGKGLAHQEMAHLLAQLEATSQPNTCPHGRPTMVHLSAAHLEREFGRR